MTGSAHVIRDLMSRGIVITTYYIAFNISVLIERGIAMCWNLCGHENSPYVLVIPICILVEKYLGICVNKALASF